MSAVLNTWILGAGAIGGTVGAALARAGHGTLLIDAWAEHVAAIRARGLHVEGRFDDQPTSLEAITPGELGAVHTRLEPPDCLIVAVKSQHTLEALQSLRPHLGADTIVACFQNGFGLEALSAMLGPERTLGAMLNWSADTVAPGRICFGGFGSTLLGEATGRSPGPVARRLADDLASISACTLTRNIQGFLWSKMCYALYLIGNALVDAPLWAVAEHPQARAALERAIAEGIRLARARRVRLEPYGYFRPDAWQDAGLPSDESERFWRACASRYSSQVKQHSGVWRDIRVRGRPSEGRHQLDALLALARDCRLDVPALAAMRRMLGEIEAGTREMRWENFGELLRPPHEPVTP